ncbi:MAG: flagellar biosynthetic protein FliO [Rhodothalassiaceae bacterium]
MTVLDIFNALLALLFVLGLMLGLYWIIRRLGAGNLGIALRRGQGERRLSLADSLMLDPRRRLVVVRCDDMDHLLLLGPHKDLIVRSMPRRADPDRPEAS